MQPFPHPSDTTHKIWSRLANWLQRYSSLKVWTTDDDGRRRRTDDRPLVYYKLTLWAFGSGELKKKQTKNKKTKQTKKKQQQQQQKQKNKQTKKTTWTYNEDSDQPHHPSSLKRILDSSYALIMDSQVSNAFSREYYWNRQRLENVP